MAAGDRLEIDRGLDDGLGSADRDWVCEAMRKIAAGFISAPD
jgi:hypothetical protein